MAIPLREAPPESADGSRFPHLDGGRFPSYARAVLEALRFEADASAGIRGLDDAGLRKLLAFCDSAQLTLTLNYVCRSALPPWVRARIDGNVQSYALRFDRLQNALFEIAREFEDRGIGFVVLKGATHSPDFTPDPLLRVQGDIDLWCRPESIPAARQAMLDLGYRAAGIRDERHLPPMIRDIGWQWRGDYFAADLPVAVELHHHLWDERMERIRVPAVEEFWHRRETASINGRDLPVLALEDALAFAALHLLMHLLHGDLRLQRAWEIANFLERRSSDLAFWSTWRRNHPDELRRLELIVFRLVSGWFGCRVPGVVVEETRSLPPDILLWIEWFGLSPVEALFRPNKDEIWLQLSLIEPLRDKCAVLVRRVLPVRTRRSEPSSIPGSQRLRFAASRTLHHTRSLAPAIWSGARWWRLRSRLGGGFLRYQFASALFCLGMSIFVLLYNLYLLGLGYNEKFLGQVSSLMSLGTFLGALPAAAVSRRFGLRNTLLTAISGCAAAAFLRAWNASPPWLYTTALLHGAFLSTWAVSYAPAIAGLSNRDNRQRAFSLACAAGMSVGILGGIVGGQLPGLVFRTTSLFPVECERVALLAAAALAATALWPARNLKFALPACSENRVFPRGRFVHAFLISIGCWTLAVGAFNPFFSAFFAQRWRMDAPRIGFLFSGGQIVQVIAVLAAPWVLRRLGGVRGVVAMQVATALSLVLLAVSPGQAAAAALYVGYASFQYMSEPGILSMLMNRVGPAERNGASALCFLVTSLAASVSALAGGAGITRFGYPAVLIACALVAVLAGLLLRATGHDDAVAITSPTVS